MAASAVGASSGLNVWKILIYVSVALMTFVFFFPFWNVVVMSFNDPMDLTRGYPTWWPRILSIKNYQDVFSSRIIFSAFTVSLARTVVGTIVVTLFSGMLAFCLSRRDLVGGKLINSLFLFTMFFGGGLIPTYLVIRQVGLINNFLVYVIPYTVNVFYMLVMKSYYASLPQSVEEAAVIDGCNDVQTFFVIILPMSIPVYAAIAVYCAVGQWNAWWDNYIYVPAPSLMTLQLFLVKLIREASMTMAQMGSAFVGKSTSNPLGIRMSTTVLVMLPIMLVYPFAQKYFVKGITIGAVKG
jgi:putative aldouronate transport system permease protein